MQRTRWAVSLPALLCVLLPLLDLAWNLTHLNLGLPDFYGLALPARALALHGAWPQTPYFPVLYPLLLAPFGLAGSVLVGGYILSAGGMTLALFAVRRLWLVGCRPACSGDADLTQTELVQAGLHPTGVAVILLAWLMPVWRVAAGSPSVDALYTGLGLWFIAAAVTAWRGELGPRAIIILWITAFLLPLLRYHALILVIPVAVLLFFRLRLKSRWTAIAVLKAGIAALVINYLGYMLAYGTALPAVASLQVRCGIEFAQHIHYASPQALWDDYAAFAQHARATPLLADYSSAQLAQHVARSFVMFLRQPAILLALLCCGVLLILRQRDRSRAALPVGAVLLCGWLLLYCLSLSAAYYTARAALLPALVGLALCAALALRLPPAAGRGVFALLLVGYLLGSRFAWQDYLERAGGRRAVAIQGNPWCLPPATHGSSWLDDPAIPPQLLESAGANAGGA